MRGVMRYPLSIRGNRRNPSLPRGNSAEQEPNEPQGFPKHVGYTEDLAEDAGRGTPIAPLPRTFAKLTRLPVRFWSAACPPRRLIRSEAKMARPAHKPDAAVRRQVEAMAGYGVPEAEIAGVIGVDRRRRSGSTIAASSTTATSKPTPKLPRTSTAKPPATAVKPSSPRSSGSRPAPAGKRRPCRSCPPRTTNRW